MKVTIGWPRRTAVYAFCLLALILMTNSSEAFAQELVVVLSSAEDGASADKLAELIREPFERVAAASLEVLPPTAAGGCRTGGRIELHLDNAGRSVRLIRCRDATVLARGLDPDAARQTPYLGAFVAAELLAIDRELEAAEARTTRNELANQAVSEPVSQPAAVGVSSAATSGSSSTAPPPTAASVEAPAASAVELQLRAGAELTLWGAPFDHTVRPSFGLGGAFALAGMALFTELSFGLFALAESERGRESLALQRHDGALHAGLRFVLGPLYLSGFALARASLTHAQYDSDLDASDTYLRFGVGVGMQADVPLNRVIAVYVQAKLDVATSQSAYLVAGQSWGTDPSSLLWVGLGLLLRVHL